jgi:hypothetical protein
MKTITILSSILTLVLPFTAHAKPLSYVGGTMVMQENDETGHTLSLDYTFTPVTALGFYIKQEENGKEILMLTPESTRCSNGGTCRTARETSST